MILSATREGKTARSQEHPTELPVDSDERNLAKSQPESGRQVAQWLGDGY